MYQKLMHLPNFLIIKVVLWFDETIHDFVFVSTMDKLNQHQLAKSTILSKHPLIIKVNNTFYHIKQLNENDFHLINFCLNVFENDFQYNDMVLENYFTYQSKEI